MSWLRVDDRLFLHPKWAATPPAARGLWISALSYCGCQMTDGFVSARLLSLLGGTEADAQALVESGLWEEAEGGYQIHDFGEYNPTRGAQCQDQERLSQVRARAGRAGGLRSAETRRANRRESDPPAARSNLEANAKQNEAPGPDPDPVPDVSITTSPDDDDPTRARDEAREERVVRRRRVGEDDKEGGREPSPATLADDLLEQADGDPSRRHWREALERLERQTMPASAGAWRLRVLRNWLQGDGAPDLPLSPAGWEPPQPRRRLGYYEEREERLKARLAADAEERSRRCEQLFAQGLSSQEVFDAVMRVKLP